MDLRWLSGDKEIINVEEDIDIAVVDLEAGLL
jgi:hypothetical protein